MNSEKKTLVYFIVKIAPWASNFRVIFQKMGGIPPSPSPSANSARLCNILKCRWSSLLEKKGGSRDDKFS